MGKASGRRKKSSQNPAANPIPQQRDPSPPPASSNSTANGTSSDLDPSLFLKRAQELKEEGNRMFQSKDYAAALASYDRALRLLPRAHPDRAVFHSNRAACLMQMRPVDHQAVAAECSLALQAQPNFPRALLRRARALDALRRYDLALKDVHALLAVDPTNRDAIDLARKLGESSATAAAQQQPQHQQPSPAALGASAVRGAPIAGLGPCLPVRPVPRKSTSPPPVPTPSNKTPSLPEKSQLSPPVNSNSNLNFNLGPLPNGLREVVLKPAKAVAATKTATQQLAVAATVSRWRPLKLVYDHDIRLAQMPANCSFKILREVVGKRFPSSKAVLIKYKDDDGDLVTVTSTAELRLAESSVDKGTKESSTDKAMKDEGTLAVLRLHVVEVSPDQEPQVAEEEEEVLEKPAEEEGSVKGGDETGSHWSTGDDSVSLGLVNDTMKTGSEEEASQGEVTQSKETGAKKECDHAECKEVEIDDWLYDFAQLFRQQVGIDPDAHLDLHELGLELCTEAVEEAVTSEDAQSLFELAAAKFQEVAALAFFNWGNVHMCAARKKIPLDESASKEVMAAQLCVAYDWVREKYALAGEKYEEALRIKPDFYEGLLALGQQHFETAKLQWSFALANKADLTAWDSSETINLFDSAEEKMKSATKMWEKVEEQRINELKDPNLSKKEELLKKRKKQGSGADGHGELSAEEVAEQAAVMRSQPNFVVQDATSQKSKEKDNDVSSISRILKKYKLKFTKAWLSFLRLPLPLDIYKEVLVNLHQNVFPYMVNPAILCDFLTRSYDIGGVISVMALSGLFVLMTQHGLEYPRFYEKLYALLTPAVFMAKHRAVFFELVDTCLKSSHLPAYLAAAFAKKLSRLTLSVPPQGALVIVALIHNLLRRHPSINFLVHKDINDDTEGDVSMEGNNSNEVDQTSDSCLAVQRKKHGIDPFRSEENDPSKSNAMRSSLWEVDTLRHHYCPLVSRNAASLENDLTVRSKTYEVNVADFSSASYSTLYLKEERRNVKQVPLAFYRVTPKTLFWESDFPGWSFGYGLGNTQDAGNGENRGCLKQ